MKWLLALSMMFLIFEGCSSDDKKGDHQDLSVSDMQADMQVVADQAPIKSDAMVGDTSLSDSTVMDQGAGKDAGKTPKVLTSTNHAGWRKTTCKSVGCHPKLSSIHTVSEPPQCAPCHGANGANKPPSGHKQSDSCTNSCHAHGQKHGFQSNADCIACHYAQAGVVQK